MKKTVILLCFAAFVSLSFIAIDNKPRFKNLKVLPRDINKHQLDSVMDHFTVALGVKCTFCHVRLNDEQKNFDFASDDNNHKKIARNMMRMTNKLNKKYFDIKNSKAMEADLEVSCFTCHGGKVHPAKFPTPVADSTKK